MVSQINTRGHTDRYSLPDIAKLILDSFLQIFLYKSSKTFRNNSYNLQWNIDMYFMWQISYRFETDHFWEKTYAGYGRRAVWCMNCLRPAGLLWSRVRILLMAWMLDVYMCFIVCVCSVLCLGRGLATNWSFVQGVLLIVNGSGNWKETRAHKGCRDVQEEEEKLQLNYGTRRLIKLHNNFGLGRNYHICLKSDKLDCCKDYTYGRTCTICMLKESYKMNVHTRSESKIFYGSMRWLL
jgi:hypothetical protein